MRLRTRPPLLTYLTYLLVYHKTTILKLSF